MPALAAPPPAAGLFLSVIHEGDPIPRADGPYVRWLLALYLDAHNRVPELPPRELLNAGLPLLLRSSVLPAAPVELFRFAQAGAVGSLEATVMGNPRMHDMGEYLASLGLGEGDE